MTLGQAIYDRSPIWLQSRLIGLHGRRLKRRRFGATYRAARAALEAAEQGGPEAIQSIEGDLLRKLIARASTDVPYYRELFGKLGLSAADIQTTEDLQKLPILTKETVRNRRQDLISERFSKRELIYAHTSGSTGAGLKLFWDANVDAWTNAVLWHSREWAGIPFGTPYGTLMGRIIHAPKYKDPPFWRRNRPWRQAFYSTFHMSARNLDAYVADMKDQGIQALEAYPSAAYVLANHLLERETTLPLRAVFTTTEPLMDFHRSAIEQAFSCRVFDYFAAAERGVYAAECEAHEGMHVFDEYGIAEVLDDEAQPVADGDLGRLVVTPLHNYAMPLIRYEQGDISGFRAEPCPCGRARRRLDEVTTKVEDLLVLPDGRRLPPSSLTHVFKPIESIAESQIVQERIDRVVVNVVPKPTYTTAHEAEVLRAMRERLGEGVHVTVQCVPEIARGPRGKLRWVVSKVERDRASVTGAAR